MNIIKYLRMMSDVTHRQRPRVQLLKVNKVKQCNSSRSTLVTGLSDFGVRSASGGNNSYVKRTAAGTCV